jgi:hypothetical protein
MRKPLGFMSGTGAVAAGVVIVALGAWTALQGPVLFSPGPLNAVAKSPALGGVASHAALRGDCEACHSIPWRSGTMTEKCLGCHREVAKQISSRSGLHGALVGKLKTPTCRGCHPEHHGAHGELTVVDAGSFPHAATGYSLASHNGLFKGRSLTCKDCHPKGLNEFDQTTCADCHKKIDAAFLREHEQAFGAECLACHKGGLRDGNFDHNQLPFKLTGKHKGVACKGCHKAGASIEQLQNTPTECLACHQNDDAHKGAFGKDCGACHSTAGWDNATFEHSAFPVNHGRQERKATCKTCHPKDVTSYTCYGCHAHTPAGTLAQHREENIKDLSDCVKCHKGGKKEG